MKLKKCIFLFATIILSGCSTVPQQIDIPKVQAPANIMKDCDPYIIPKDGQLSTLMTVILDNKKIYEICNNQNRAKKEFIERNSQ